MTNVPYIFCSKCRPKLTFELQNFAEFLHFWQLAAGRQACKSHSYENPR